MTERYPRVWVPELRRVVRLHRLQAEQLLGRALAPGEVVHHRDGDRANSRPENLRVMPSQRAHAVLHHYERREARGIVPLFDLETILAALEPARVPAARGRTSPLVRRRRAVGAFPGAVVLPCDRSSPFARRPARRSRYAPAARGPSPRTAELVGHTRADRPA